MNTSPSSQSPSPPVPQSPAPVLVRIPEVFAGIAKDVLKTFGASTITPLGTDFYLIKTLTPRTVRHSPASLFVRWAIPVEHSWPCNPQKTEGFIEKAAQTLFRKFGPRNPQTILIGQVNPGSPNEYYKTLASNLRGRTLQLFPPARAATVEEQKGDEPTLFCLLGKEGLFCGMATPREANGLYAGGSKYIGHESPDTISRAGAKIAEALHYRLMYRPSLPSGVRWLELGASPGGMTSELLTRGYRVTAIDRAELDQRVVHHKGLTFVQMDVAEFEPRDAASYDAILCDMNGDADESIEQVIRLSRYLKKDGLVVFTVKLPRVETVQGPLALCKEVIASASGAGLRLFAQTHLTYNRHEFTLFFEKKGDMVAGRRSLN